MRLRFSFLAKTTLAALIVAGCGGGGGDYPTTPGGQNPPPGGQPPSTSASITVENNRFDPAATTVSAGTTVTWTWDTCRDDGYGSSVCTAHDVTFDAGGGSSTQTTGSYSRQFSTAGTFGYRCSVHGAAMTGSVTVR